MTGSPSTRRSPKAIATGYSATRSVEHGGGGATGRRPPACPAVPSSLEGAYAKSSRPRCRSVDATAVRSSNTNGGTSVTAVFNGAPNTRDPGGVCSAGRPKNANTRMSAHRSLEEQRSGRELVQITMGEGSESEQRGYHAIVEQQGLTVGRTRRLVANDGGIYGKTDVTRWAWNPGRRGGAIQQNLGITRYRRGGGATTGASARTQDNGTPAHHAGG